MKILIVEDNDKDRKILRMNIERHGCEAIESINGVEALETLKQMQPGLIISDALMPHMDGFALLRAVKKDHSLASIPFVFYSAVYTGAQDKELALSLGADAFVAKPMEPEHFWQRLQEILKNCRLRGNARPQLTVTEEDDYYRRYSTVVATKLDEKVRELEAELERRQQLEAERETMIKELGRARDEWERTFNAMPEVITIQDKDYRITRCNEATCRLLGVTLDEILGQRCYERLWGKKEQCRHCPAQQTFNDADTHEVEFFQGNINKTFLVSTTPVFNDTGESESVIHIAKDITDLKDVEARYRHAQKMEAIGTLAGGIAHDFNNILTAILGYAELVQKDLLDSGKSSYDIDQVILAGKRATDLVRQILTFSRQTEQERQPLRLQYIVKEVLKLLRPSLPATLKIRQDINESCGEVLADTSQIHQMVMNLCTNAYQAMGDKGGFLEVSLEEIGVINDDLSKPQRVPVGNYVVLTVSDTGCGMDKETREKIFDPYFTTKKASGGTGLGLAVVHGIVTAYGGHIVVDSEPGQGATFTLYLPVIHEKNAVPSLPPPIEQSLPRGSERILFVDDEKILVHLGKKILESLGYQVTTVSDSTEALAIFGEDPEDFDLIITDLSMPCLDGIELSRKILAKRPDIPIILYSGYGETIKREEAKAIGIKEFATKPMLQNTLALTIRRVLGS